MRVVAVGGVPAVGKSALVRAILPRLGTGFDRVAPIKVNGVPQPLAWTDYPEAGVRVLGTYLDGEQFPGTDRLSLSLPAVIAAELGTWHRSAVGPPVLLFEGARFFTARTIGAVVAAIYPTQPGKVRFAARMTITAHVEYLEARGELRVKRGLLGTHLALT